MNNDLICKHNFDSTYRPCDDCLLEKTDYKDKYIELLEKHIKTLEEKIISLETPTVIIPAGQKLETYPYQLPLTCDHEYPNPWMGIIPPHCKKCGKQGINWNITSNIGDST